MHKIEIVLFFAKKFSWFIVLLLVIALGLWLYHQSRAQQLILSNDNEYSSPDEKIAITKLKNLIITTLKKEYPPGTWMHRDAHAKQLGCVRANFTVNHDKLPMELRVGIFSENKTFPAWIRFSNASKELRADNILDQRGMAIKLMQVPGEKILPQERSAKTQDFLLGNMPIFIGSNIERSTQLLSVNKLQFSLFLLTHPRALFNIFVFLRQANNPLSLSYWSQTPYALGSTAVKYRVTPCYQEKNNTINHTDANYLAHAMAKTLAHQSACFEFFVQLHKTGMSIDTPDQRWDEKKSPFIPVATITIFQQQVDNPQTKAFCENLSFTPWHSLPEHSPLGAINRARKIIYEAISILRHQQNHIKREEPEPSNWPK